MQSIKIYSYYKAILTCLVISGYLFINSQTLAQVSPQSIDLERSTNDHLYISDSNQSGLDLSGNLSIEGWVQLESLPSSVAPSEYGIVSKYKASTNDRGYRLSILEDDKLQLAVSSDGTTANLHNIVSSQKVVASSDIGEWIHFAATYDISSNTGVLYKNGEIIESTSVLTGTVDSILNNQVPFAVGSSNYTSINTFDGKLDEIKVWNDVRTPSEITDNFSKCLPESESNLVGYWKFDGNFIDESINNNDLLEAGSLLFSSDISSGIKCSYILEPINLNQFRIDGVSVLADGQGFVGNGVVFSGEVGVDDGGVKRALEVEVKTMGDNFDGNSTHVSDFGTQSTAQVQVSDFFSKTDLYGGNNSDDFKWRARTVDENGEQSEWVEFGDTNVDFSLSAVPLMTQVESPYPGLTETASWSNEVFADGRANTEGDCGLSIAQCGCAISSLSTLAIHHGITTGVDGMEINPHNLNQWLLNNNGYTHDGSVQWEQALLYFGTEENGVKKSYFTWDTITTDQTVITDTLSSTPVIAYKQGLPGGYSHFLVIDSLLSSSYEVSDPQWFNTQTSDDSYSPSNKIQDYNNEFTSARIIKVNAGAVAPDKFLEVRLSGEGELEVTDDAGNVLGANSNEIEGGVYEVESALDNGEEHKVAPARQTKVARIFDVTSDYYTIIISGNEAGDYVLSIFQMDEDGSSTLDEFIGTLKKNSVETFNVLFEGEGTLLDDFMTQVESAIDVSKKNTDKRFGEQLYELQSRILAGALVVKDVPLKLLEKWGSRDKKNQFPLVESILNHLLK